MTITDPQLMRALAHPARVAILEHLSSSDSVATATECAEVAGLSPSATSYHLRELAKHGLIAEAPSRGDGRERVWRSAITGFQIEPGHRAPPDTRAAEQELVDVVLARDDDRLRRWQERAPHEPPEWYDAVMVSNSVLLLTAEELTALNQAVLALCEPYKRRNREANAPAGARIVAAQYRRRSPPPPPSTAWWRSPGRRACWAERGRSRSRPGAPAMTEGWSSACSRSWPGWRRWSVWRRWSTRPVGWCSCGCSAARSTAGSTFSTTC
jgi:DNA-binding transcriptional ArsR family regulator